ncbi:unnamed protein product [Blumeria hordei]|uniref:Uncharacterized protein n=2 Tax=Blumeria hordei TaxID=2867405 RepID=A0A383UTR9_BLUHO|nr:Bgh-specific protein [Blumeria hordei DH14]SZF03753.1 unnamed protein product [Blumeria hordei]
MISCVFAFLLLSKGNDIYDKGSLASPRPSKQLPNLRRLVLVAEDTEESFYGDFEAPNNNNFPKMSGDYDIFMTKEQVRYEDTRFQAYCSPTLSPMQIAATIQDQLGPRVKFQYPKLNNNRALSSENCLSHIYTELEGVKKGASSQTQVITQSSICSNSDIIGLAFQGNISVSGVYYPYAPSNGKNVPQVAFSGHLDLQDLVRENHIYTAHEKKKQIHMVLVWYFGQLHIFRKDGMNKLWWPVTEIGSTKHNGAIIINFLRHSLGLFKRLDQILESSRPQRSLFPYIWRPSTSVQPRKGTSTSNLMAEIVSTEFGIPPKVPLKYLDSYLRK